MRKFSKKKKMPEPYDYAIFMITLRAQTTDYLREKMLSKGYLPDDINNVIQRLTELKYLDDRQFAQNYFENLKKYKLVGYYGAKMKLMQKKVPTDLIEEMLEQYTEKEEYNVAKALLEKDSVKRKTKPQLMYFLRSRGFRTPVTSKLILKQFKNS
jgi:regulatory protein